MKRDARARASDKTDRATYVYCLVAASREPAMPRTLGGVPGSGRVRLVEIGPGRWLAASDVPLRQYDEAAIQRGLSKLDWVSRAAVAHERVVETFIDQPAVVPMKLFTIFRNDERAVANVRSAAQRIEETIKRVAGQHEWTVRVVRVRAPVAEQPASGGSGVGYLTRKKALRDARARDTRGVREAAAAALDDLSALATSVRRRPKPEVPAATPLVLDAAFLLPRNRRARFRAAAARWARRLGEHGCEVTLTGPWPAYSFVAS